MTDEFNWDKAVNEWQSHEPDLPELKKNMRWLSWRMKLVLALDIVSLLLLVPFAFYIFQTEESFSVKVWVILVSILATIGVYFDFYLRRELWEVPTTTRGLYEHMIKRAKVGINIARFAIIYLSVFGLFLAGWSAYAWLYEAARFDRANSTFSVLIGIGVVVVSIIISFWYGKRKAAQLRQAEKQFKDFVANDEG